MVHATTPTKDQPEHLPRRLDASTKKISICACTHPDSFLNGNLNDFNRHLGTGTRPSMMTTMLAAMSTSTVTSSQTATSLDDRVHAIQPHRSSLHALRQHAPG